MTAVLDRPPPPWQKISDGIRVRPMVEGNGSAIILYYLDAGHRFARHEHACAELAVVLAGLGRTHIGSEERTLREGDSVYIPPGVPHGLEVDRTGPMVMMNVTVPSLATVFGPTTAEIIDRARRLAASSEPSVASVRPRRRRQ